MWAKKSDVSFSNSHTVIAGGTEVSGDIRFNGELHIEGKICGNISADSGTNAKITVSEKGVVEGEIRVPTVVINGSVSGDVHSSNHVELAAKAIVKGDVHYNMIEMVKGSQVNGNLVYNGEGGKKQSQQGIAAGSAIGSSKTASTSKKETANPLPKGQTANS